MFGSFSCVFSLTPVLYFGCFADLFHQYQALRFLHGYGIVHKNIKSPNVLLDRRGKAKLSDFSLADISATINGDTGGGYHSNVSSALSKICVRHVFRHSCVLFMRDCQTATRTVAAWPSRRPSWVHSNAKTSSSASVCYHFPFGGENIHWHNRIRIMSGVFHQSNGRHSKSIPGGDYAFRK